MNYPLAVEVLEGGSKLSNPETGDILGDTGLALEMDWSGTMNENQARIKRRRTHSGDHPEHEIEDKEAVLVVLECVAEIDYEGVVDLQVDWGQCPETRGRDGEIRTSSSSLCSCMIFATAFWRMQRALSMYLRA